MGLVLPPMRLKKDLSPEELPFPTSSSDLQPNAERTPLALGVSVRDPWEYDRWHTLRWNSSPRLKRDVRDWLLSSTEADLTAGFTLGLGLSSSGSSYGGGDAFRLQEPGR